LPLETDFAACPAADRAAAVSVNPAAAARARARIAGLCLVGEEIAVPIPIRYDPPGDCGLDRVMGVVGALARLPEAEAILLFDAGTCLTATLGIRGEGVVGGAILPGPDLMARSLAEGTARLPLVEPAPPISPIGGSTVESIRSGVAAAFAGAARELVQRFRAACDRPFRVVAAGTGAGALAAAVPEIDTVHPFATLWGVYRTARAD